MAIWNNIINFLTSNFIDVIALVIIILQVVSYGHNILCLYVPKYTYISVILPSAKNMKHTSALLIDIVYLDPLSVN